MRRKKCNKNKTSKVVIFKPFERVESSEMIPFNEECNCNQDSSTKDVSKMDVYELKDLEDSLVADIMDYDTIIDIQLDPNKSTVGFDKETLKMDRQRRQKLVVELRAVRDRIKMLKYGNQEVAIAV